jgi:hypothetical protein
MKTAVEWLADEIIMLEERLRQEEINLNDFMDLKDDLVTKALEMEKKAHKETWDVAHQAGRFEGKGIAEENWQTFETYWEENN